MYKGKCSIWQSSSTRFSFEKESQTAHIGMFLFFAGVIRKILFRFRIDYALLVGVPEDVVVGGFRVEGILHGAAIQA